MTIGERIKRERLDQGLSQQDLAERMGKKSKTSVCRVEKNVEDLTTTRVMAYARALGVPIDRLIKDTEPAKIILTDAEKDLILKLRHIDRGTYENITTLVDVAYDKYLERKKEDSKSLKDA